MDAQLDMLGGGTDPNDDLIGFEWESESYHFVATGTGAQPTYMNVTQTVKATGKQLASCRQVQVVRALRSGLI